MNLVSKEKGNWFINLKNHISISAKSQKNYDRYLNKQKSMRVTILYNSLAHNIKNNGQYCNVFLVTIVRTFGSQFKILMIT